MQLGLHEKMMHGSPALTNSVHAFASTVAQAEKDAVATTLAAAESMGDLF